MVHVALYGNRYNYLGSCGALAVGVVDTYGVKYQNMNRHRELCCVEVAGGFSESFMHLDREKEEVTC